MIVIAGLLVGYVLYMLLEDLMAGDWDRRKK
jgi:hypothetical protein